MNSMASRYLIVYPCNGLCNRLRATASAYILSKYLNRQFLMCWEITSDIGGASFEQLFEPVQFSIDNDKVQELCSYNSSTIYTCGRRTEIAILSDVCKDASNIVIIKQTGGNYMHPKMSIGEFNTQKNLFYTNYIKPIPEISQTIKEFYNNNELPGGCIGVHIRRTDRSYYTPVSDAFVSKVKQILETTNINRVLLCSDDVKEIASFKTKLKSHDVSIVHYTKEYFGRDNVDAVRDAVIEWFLLGHCNIIVYSHSSSFGYEACILNKTTNGYELRSDNSKRTENEIRNLPPLRYL